ncbi:hypothetical protein E4U22_002772 [Claviceps purpurea]|nr:hypothetical protein E4U22_002772 [Claviceps purpurea]
MSKLNFRQGNQNERVLGVLRGSRGRRGAAAGFFLCEKYPRKAPEICPGYVPLQGRKKGYVSVEAAILCEKFIEGAVVNRKALLVSEKTFASKYSSIMVTKLREAISAETGDDLVRLVSVFVSFEMTSRR